ncbi:hypothetical protein PUR49_32540 [Streptomyces sp. BE147]|uniref:hypothetical protein n=1 Tax=Streptomyces sp. BE147 TaxID=3002524 RepID=UPI002E76A4FF|nr:hypothetical protein [Streptomyces sp. BE147]MEE1741201.1 hypothetical protein [Streptomyces sp. BE147]
MSSTQNNTTNDNAKNTLDPRLIQAAEEELQMTERLILAAAEAATRDGGVQ